jgi:hypothetical protein
VNLAVKATKPPGIVLIIGFYLIGIGLFVTGSYIVQPVWWLSMWPNDTHMVVNAGMGFLLLGTGLLAGSQARVLLQQVVGVLISVLGLVTLDLVVDNLFISQGPPCRRISIPIDVDGVRKGKRHAQPLASLLTPPVWSWDGTIREKKEI